MASRAQGETARILHFPDLKPARRKELLGQEIGTSFDYGQRLFAFYGSGDVFDYGEWSARDMKNMLRRDGQCSAIELVLTLPIREADRDIVPAKGDRGETDLVKSVLMAADHEGGIQTPIEDVIGQTTSGQIYRKAHFETTWKIRDSDGKIVYDKIAYRPPATCQSRYDERTGAPNGFRQQVWLFGGNLALTKGQKTPGYVDIPKIRSAIYVHGKHREPLVGISEMDIAYWCYRTKMKLLYLWYNFLENLAMQRIIVYGNDEPEAEARAADVAALKGAGVVGLPHPESGQKAFDTIEAGDAGSMFKDAMGFLESWQIGSVLAGFMGLTGAATGGRGSYALSQDQSSFYLKSRQAVAKEIAGFFTHQIIRPLVVVNFGPDAAIPSWKFGPLQDEQIQALLTLFGQIVAAPALHIPIEFVDLLAERMASVLQLDVDVVHQALAASAAQRAQQLMAGPAAQQAAAGGMPPTAIQGIGQLAGVANAGLSIARQATAPGRGGPPQALPTQQLAARQAAAGPPRPGAGLRPQAGPHTPPAKPPMTPPPGRMA